MVFVLLSLIFVAALMVVRGGRFGWFLWVFVLVFVVDLMVVVEVAINVTRKGGFEL